ncbi:MFS transporter [Corticibacter populi]|uniref:MFS transporter n=1 Tax=Corticibacter populi TaxID=1550736 RepID=A0A3M6QZS2_9BURK|nr:MFS transporter [Corticibacter populi]RMX08455.1 MFS transporter [Corticibacter populi]RZS35764.1 putative MFS family arabinose efflux permease [Corticibacter populi]
MRHPPPKAFRLLPLLAAALVGTMAMMAYVAIIGPLVRRLGVSELVAGVSMAIGGVFWMLMARWWGRLSDRRGRKRVLLIGLGVFGLTYLALAVFVDAALRQPLPALWVAVVLIATRSVIGAFYAAVPPTAAATIADNVAPEGRHAAMAKLGSANALGMVAGPAIISQVSAQGLEWGFYATAMLPLLGFACIALWLPAQIPVAATASAKPLQPSMPAPRPGVPGRAAPMALWDRRLRPAVLTAFIAMMSVAVAQVSVGFFAMDRLGLDETGGARAAGHALACVGVALMLSQQFVIRLPHIALPHWVLAGALISAGGFASVFLAHSLPGLLLAYAVGAFGMGFIFPSFQAMAANAVAAHEQGAAAGNVSAAQGLGMVLGPLIGTGLYQLAPVAPYLWIAAALLLLAISTLASGAARPHAAGPDQAQPQTPRP